jgi:hypothetical protein
MICDGSYKRDLTLVFHFNAIPTMRQTNSHYVFSNFPVTSATDLAVALPNKLIIIRAHQVQQFNIKKKTFTCFGHHWQSSEGKVNTTQELLHIV